MSGAEIVGPMWSKDYNGHFWLVFPNKHALTVDKIKEIFSSFGQVLAVTQAGDERGYRFVSYGSMEEVELAEKSLMNHPLIRFFPHRPQQKYLKNCSLNGENNDTSSEDGIANKNFFQRKSVNENSLRQKLESEEPSEFGYEFDLREKNAFANFNDSFSKEQSFELDLEDKNAFSREKNNISDAYNFQLHKKSMVHNKRGDSGVKTKKIIFHAEEIIVANIHDNYGCAYILHLLDEFEPLAISIIYTIPDNIRYCHVYLKSFKESIGAKKKFDNYNLDGKKLVVLNMSRLKQQVF